MRRAMVLGRTLARRGTRGFAASAKEGAGAVVSKTRPIAGFNPKPPKKSGVFGSPDDFFSKLVPKEPGEEDEEDEYEEEHRRLFHEHYTALDEREFGQERRWSFFYPNDADNTSLIRAGDVFADLHRMYFAAFLHDNAKGNHQFGYQFRFRDIRAGAELAFKSVADHFARGEPTFEKEWTGPNARMGTSLARHLDELLTDSRKVGLVPRLTVRSVLVGDIFAHQYPTSLATLEIVRSGEEERRFHESRTKVEKAFMRTAMAALRVAQPRAYTVFWVVEFKADEDFFWVPRNNAEMLRRVEAFQARRGGPKRTQPHLWAFSADIGPLLKRLDLNVNAPPELFGERLRALTDEEYDDLVRVRVEAMGSMLDAAEQGFRNIIAFEPAMRVGKV